MPPAVAVDEALLAAFDRVLDPRQFDADEVLLDQWMRRRPTVWLGAVLAPLRMATLLRRRRRHLPSQSAGLGQL
jgi:hypothetical protein